VSGCRQSAFLYLASSFDLLTVAEWRRDTGDARADETVRWLGSTGGEPVEIPAAASM
jgi:hypothetical protein